MDRGFATTGAQPTRSFDGDSISAPSSRVASTDRVRWALLGCVACLYAPLIFAGPGSDPDSMRELHSGLTLLWRHRYVMSRPPGYFPYEALCGILYRARRQRRRQPRHAGDVVGAARCFPARLRALRGAESLSCSRRRWRFIRCIGPASTSTIDFIWALGCFFVGFRLLLNHRYFGAAAMLGLAVGIRLSSVLLAGPLLVWELVARPRDGETMDAPLRLRLRSAPRSTFRSLSHQAVRCDFSPTTSARGHLPATSDASFIRTFISGACPRRCCLVVATRAE